MLTSGGLGADSSYSTGQSTGALSRDSPPVSENNTDGKDNPCRKLMQESLGFDKSQKGSVELDVSYGNLKQESSYLSDSVQGDVILVGN